MPDLISFKINIIFKLNETQIKCKATDLSIALSRSISSIDLACEMAN